MQRSYQALVCHISSLLHRRNVVGCGLAFKETKGIRTNQPCVAVLVESKIRADLLAAEDLIPSTVEDVPTDVIEVGALRLMGTRTGRIRPAQPGVSIGHYRVSAGTFGAVVYDRITGSPLVLSNNHVLANETSGTDGRAQIGDPIYQPGTYDGGNSDDVIATLERFVPLRLPPPRLNLADAAVGTPLDTNQIRPEILGLGLVSGTDTVQVGDKVYKSGRSTGVTSGEVRVVSATLQVLLSEGRSAMFTNQIVCSPMCESGDSGSLGVTTDNKAFGLLFAGSPLAAVFNRIDFVLEQLGVTI